MLFILIPIAWLSILALFVAVCRAAADGDAQLSPAAPPLSGPIGTRLVLAHDLLAPARSARRPHRRQAPQRVAATASRRRRLAAHGGGH
jgi:hypothetical protein